MPVTEAVTLVLMCASVSLAEAKCLSTLLFVKRARVTKMADRNEGARARTWDLLLKRQLLYQLSYAPDDGFFHRSGLLSLA